jgi:DNA-binding MurR/RpiR family transcriptional regulator
MSTTELSLDERVAARRDRLSRAEQRVADFIAGHRDDAAFLPAADIASRLGTSDATVVRAVKSLGYAGLPELKHELIDAIRGRAPEAQRLATTLDEVGDDPEATLELAISVQIAHMEEARRTVRPADFRRAVELLAGAPRIAIFGVGPSAHVAQYFAIKLNRIGHPAEVISETGFMLADRLLGLEASSALVVIAFGPGFAELEVVVEHARRHGVPVVLLTDVLGGVFEGRVDAVLSARRAPVGLLTSHAVTLVVLDALLMGIGARNRELAVRSMESLTKTRDEIRGRRRST